MKFKAKFNYKEFLAYIDKIRTNLNTTVLIAIISGAIIAICTYNIYQFKASSYLIKVNNKPIGYVKKLSDVKRILNSIKSTEGDKATKSINYSRTLEPVKSFLTVDEAEKVIRCELGLKIQAVAIFANDVEVAKVHDKNTAEKIIQRVKEYYYPKMSNGMIQILSSNIKEKITYKDVLVESKEILNVDDAVKKIVNGRNLEKNYIVKKGDTIWDIAIKNNMMLEELKAANPNINIDKIDVGQEIKLAVNQPYLNVEIVAKIKEREEIPFDTKEFQDKNLSKGIRKVKVAGKNGVQDLEKVVTFLNSDTLDEDVVKSTIIRHAVDEVIAVGTKVSTYVATGRFVMPSRGYISSKFGYRWGRMHEGIDIAAPRGTAIIASESGKVTFAGWRSGYGYCVMISHGNGYQTLYGHASKLYAKTGQYVKKGQKIAAVGSTGRSTGSHVHFEVRQRGACKNPLKYIK
ncbi:MAG: peptidoglycan DD-metalloendopeptidase family protein [Caloramator sp.]|nr:peptidoglycan DD-metalloendopeptidase family protein [Caloramator sp.]